VLDFLLLQPSGFPALKVSPSQRQAALACFAWSLDLHSVANLEFSSFRGIFVALV
jgi:hypothetical protein